MARWRTRRRRALDLAVLHAETAQLQAETMRAELGGLHHELARRDVEMLSVLTRLTQTIEQLRSRAERDEQTHRELSRAIRVMAMFATAPPIMAAPTAPGSVTASAGHGAGRVIGGSVDPSRTIDLTTEAPVPADAPAAASNSPSNSPSTSTSAAASAPAGRSIPATATVEVPADLPVAPASRRDRPLSCEVHLQFGDRWIDGFQIEETIRVGDEIQFRLRRQVDGWVLPELFAESEVRVFTQPVVDPAPLT